MTEANKAENSGLRPRSGRLFWALVLGFRIEERLEVSAVQDGDKAAGKISSRKRPLSSSLLTSFSRAREIFRPSIKTGDHFFENTHNDWTSRSILAPG